MSFLKQEPQYSHEPRANGLTKQLTSRSSSSIPHGYESTACYVHLRPVVKPVSTREYIHEEHQSQKNIIEALTKEGMDLFEQKPVIKKQFGQERQYKQREQFQSNVSVESLIDALEDNNLVLRCTFIREGFNSHNTCMMCTADDLKDALNKEPSDHALKTIKMELSSDDTELCPRTGTMLMTIQADQTTGQHTMYSLDYSIINQHDDKLFSEY